MEAENWDCISEMVADCTRELFASIGTDLVRQRGSSLAADQEKSAFSVIGFGGQQVRGVLVLGAPIELLAKAHPMPDAPSEDLLDWCGELSNQLVGRLKNKLLGYGIIIQLSLPTTLCGVLIQHWVRSRHAGFAHRFQADGHCVSTVFEGVAEPGVELAPITGSPEPTNPEGDCLLF